MLISLNQLLAVYGWPPSYPLAGKYDILRRFAESQVKTYCNWPIELTQITEYCNGNGCQDLPLKKPWVSKVVNVWFDQQGAGGYNPNGAFQAPPLTQGIDYMIADGGQSGVLRLLSQQAFLGFYWPGDVVVYGRRPGGLSYVRSPNWPAGIGNLKVQYYSGFTGVIGVSSITWDNGTVTVTTSAAHGLQVNWQVEVWGATPTGYNGGFTVDSIPSPTTFTYTLAANPGSYVSGAEMDAIPQEIKLAVVTAVSIFANSTKYGFPLTGESLGQHSYSLQRDLEFGTVRQILSRWRDTAVAGFLP